MYQGNIFRAISNFNITLFSERPLYFIDSFLVSVGTQTSIICNKESPRNCVRLRMGHYLPSTLLPLCWAKWNTANKLHREEKVHLWLSFVVSVCLRKGAGLFFPGIRCGDFLHLLLFPRRFKTHAAHSFTAVMAGWVRCILQKLAECPKPT